MTSRNSGGLVRLFGVQIAQGLASPPLGRRSVAGGWSCHLASPWLPPRRDRVWSLPGSSPGAAERAHYDMTVVGYLRFRSNMRSAAPTSSARVLRAVRLRRPLTKGG